MRSTFWLKILKERPGHRLAHKKIGWKGMDWIHPGQDRDQCCEHGNELLGSIKGR
jgi:hypothetical protein